MHDKADLTTGSLKKHIWQLAWPMMLSIFFHALYNIVDTFWVSKLSPESIAAVSISQITLFLMISIGIGITIGSGVLMAMDIGAKNKPGAERILGQSFVLTGLAGVFFTILALTFRNELLVLTGAAGNIFEPALAYFTITSGGSILFFTMITIMFAFNSQGDTLTLTKLFALSTLINLIGDPLLIFGYGPFPAMGISGAAYSTLFSQFIFIIIALKSLNSPKRAIRFHFKNLTFHWESVKQVLKIGIPAAMTQVINPIGLAAMTYMTGARFLEAGATAFSLGFRLEFFAYLPAIGFGFAAMAIMGQNIGAHKLDRSRQALNLALKYSMSIALGMGLLAALFAPQIIAVFTEDPDVTHYALLYFRSVAFSYTFIAAMMVEANGFQAIGRSWPGFWIMFLRFIVISIPMSYVLSFVFDFSIMGIWSALIAGNTIASIIGYLWLQRTLHHFSFKVVDEATHA
ncbi:MAG: MATE family efflux transporter [Candidatus Peregrinibacteria bacterium]|nr:MATE family efflux transporter [Candidatus Peregrinibacteria bacterium]